MKRNSKQGKKDSESLSETCTKRETGPVRERESERLRVSRKCRRAWFGFIGSLKRLVAATGVPV